MSEYPLERRAKLLAEEIHSRVSLLRDALAPPGYRPTFREQLSKPEALSFWKRNRYNSTGRKVIETMTPESIFELDQALNEYGDQ